jgi:hypothetical protein
MFLQINLLIAYIKNKEMTINRILGLYDKTQATNKNDVIISNGEDKLIYDFKKNDINKITNANINNNFITDDIKIIQSEYFSDPVYVSNPPKKPKENFDETKSENRNRLKSSKTESEPTIKDDDPQVITHISFNDLNKDNDKQNPIPDVNKNMKEINKASDNQIEIKKYCDTCEDISYSNQNTNKFNDKKITK